jgi:alkanesulfonate monooxygenase SsuD/methylene tetrahydromethanopterin reductase-like flavin-dependent oxidoreductase (luciferase family)
MKEKYAYSIGTLLNVKQVIEFSKSVDRNDRVHSIWTPESWGKESFSILGAISQVTNRVKLGTSIINIYSRSPATIAMGAVTLDNLSEKRFILGLGVSTPSLVEGLHGMKYEYPLTRIKEYVDIIRLLFKRGKIELIGKTVRVNGFELLEHSRENIPIYLAAVNSKMISLSVDSGDGFILYLKPLSEIEKIMSRIRTVTSSKSFTKAVAFITSVSNKNPEQANKRASKTLAFYISVGKIYYKYLLGTIYSDSVKKIYSDYHKLGINEAIKNIKPDMLNDFVVSGTVNECEYKIKQIIKKGVDLPILQINPIKDVNGDLEYKDFKDL